MMNFKCPVCGNTELYLMKKQETATKIDGICGDDFGYGKEELVACSDQKLECGKDHVLKLKNGNIISTLDEFEQWREEQKTIG